VKDRSFVEASQLGHVFDLVELGRIHLLEIIFGDKTPLARLHDLDFDLVASLPFNRGRDKAEIFVGDPDQPLLGPLSLRCRIVEGIPVDDQIFEIGIISIQPGIAVRHFEISHHTRSFTMECRAPTVATGKKQFT